MVWDKVKEFDKKLSDKLNVKNLFPNYRFEKWVFRTFFVLVAILLILIISKDGFLERHIYVECPKNAVKCINPFYVCRPDRPHEEPTALNVTNFTFTAVSFTPNQFTCLEDTPIEICDKGLCYPEFIEAGQYIGEKPSWLFQNFYVICGFLLILTILVNHVFFNRKVK